MTRKHFQALADMVRIELSFLSDEDRKRVARELAHTCSRFNANFNWPRFITACGIEED